MLEGEGIWGFPQIGGTFLWIPRIGTIVYWGLYRGTIILGNQHIGTTIGEYLGLFCGSTRLLPFKSTSKKGRKELVAAKKHCPG